MQALQVDRNYLNSGKIKPLLQKGSERLRLISYNNPVRFMLIYNFSSREHNMVMTTYTLLVKYFIVFDFYFKDANPLAC